MFLSTLLTGVTVGLISSGVKLCYTFIYEQKLNIIQSLLEVNDVSTSILSYIVISTGLTFIPSLLTAFISPIAAGSGIPELKCLMEDVYLPNPITLHTCFVKIIGVIGTVASGIPAGFEGPMIHYGAIIGSRMPHELKDNISCGIAAGVTCAFGAPLGAVFFTLEEECSRWDLNHILRVFLCAVVPMFVLQLLTGTRGIFEGSTNTVSIYYYEYFLLIPVTIVISLCGSLYVSLNTLFTMTRNEIIQQPGIKICEVLVVTAFTSLCFMIIALHGSCLDNPTAWTTRFNCPEGMYNDYATLFINRPDYAITYLFYATTISIKHLFVFCFIYIFFSSLAYGLSVPSGLFVPNILVGAGLGRLFAEVLSKAVPIHPVLYGIAGGAVMLSSVTRIVISVVLILIEATGILKIGFPLMLSVLLSKFLGDLLLAGVYQTHMMLKYY